MNFDLQYYYCIYCTCATWQQVEPFFLDLLDYKQVAYTIQEKECFPNSLLPGLVNMQAQIKQCQVVALHLVELVLQKEIYSVRVKKVKLFLSVANQFYQQRIHNIIFNVFNGCLLRMW